MSKKTTQERLNETEIARMVMSEARSNMQCLTSLLSYTLSDSKGAPKPLLNSQTRAVMAQTIDDNLVVLKGMMAQVSGGTLAQQP